MTCCRPLGSRRVSSYAREMADASVPSTPPDVAAFQARSRIPRARAVKAGVQRGDVRLGVHDGKPAYDHGPRRRSGGTARVRCDGIVAIKKARTNPPLW